MQPGHQVAELGSQLREVSTAICEALAKPGDGHYAGENELSKSFGHAKLVDVERRFPKSTKDGSRTNSMRLRESTSDDKLFSKVSTFSEISQLNGWQGAFFSESDETDEISTSRPKPYDIFVLDVNAIVGNDLEWTSLSIAREFDALNTNILDFDGNKHRSSSQLIVLVKSLALNQWATRLVPGQRWVSNKGINSAITAPHIIATVGVQEYRNTIPFTVQPGDAVLEIGCHFGTSTILLHEAALSLGANNDSATLPTKSDGYCIGVDVGSKIIQEAVNRYPNVHFRTGDAWKTAGILRIQRDYLSSSKDRDSITDISQRREIGFDVVYIDVGGLSGSDGLLEAISLISSIRFALEPRCMVIKSLCMRRLSSSLVPYWQIQKGKQSKRTK